MIQILNYNIDSSTYGLYSKISQKLKLSQDITQANRETLFLKDICKRIKKSKTVLYILEKEDEILGLISLSVTSIEEQPSMQIDYIFVNKKYRNKQLKELDNCKAFRYLIEFSINLAKDLKKVIGLRYIVLSTDNDELKQKYLSVDFKELNQEWMFLKI